MIKPITRKELTDDDYHVVFTNGNKSQEYYWSYNDNDETTKLAITLSNEESKRPESIDIVLTYLDTSKEFHPRVNFESQKKLSFRIPQKQTINRYEIDTPIKIKVKEKMLWKIRFTIKTKQPKIVLNVSL